MHEAVAEYCRKWATGDEGVGLDIGGRDVNGHPRHLWPNIDWTVLDLRDAPGVDIVADAADWTPDRLYDVVLCTEVLEHAETWRAIVTTAADALAPGGRLVITCAAPGRAPHSAIEATAIQPGEYYRNIPHTELGALLEYLDLTVEDCRQNGFDTQATARRI